MATRPPVRSARLERLRVSGILALTCLLMALDGAPAFAGPAAPRIQTVAGGGVGDGLPGRQTWLTPPAAVAAAPSGNLYWTETNHLVGLQRVRMWDRTADRVRTVAGYGGLPPTDLALLGDGGPAAHASLWNALGIAVDAAENVYIADTGNSRIRHVDPATGLVRTIVQTALPEPSPIEVDRLGRVWFGTYSGVSRWDPITEKVTVMAGGGTVDADGQPATSVRVGRPQDIAVDDSGNLYLSVGAGTAMPARIRWVDTQGFIHTVVGGPTGVTTAEGAWGSLTSIHPYNWHLLLLRPDGSLWFTDTGRIRRLASRQELFWVPGSRAVTTVVTLGGGMPDGPLGDGHFDWVGGWDETADGGFVVADPGQLLLRTADAAGSISTRVGNGLPWRWDPDGDDVTDWTGDGRRADEAALSDPCAVAADADGNVFVSGTQFHRRIRRIDATTGVITTLAGTNTAGYSGDGGPATAARLHTPSGLVFDGAGNLYVADAAEHRVRRIRTDGVIITVAGNGAEGFSGDGGKATAARLSEPRGLAVAADGALLIADTGNAAIRRVAPDGTISTLAGPAAGLQHPTGVAVDPGSGAVLVADASMNTVARIAGTSLVPLAGDGRVGFCGDGGPAAAACLRGPSALAATAQGLLIVDRGNARVRLVTNG